ncbi:MAG: glycoside hydrolase family 16 protein, partial [Acidobacteriota bacterium]
MFRTSISLLLVIGSGITASIASSATARAQTRSPATAQPAVSPMVLGKNVSSGTLFDDFNYLNTKQVARHGWIIRTAVGWPGIPGATWGDRGISFLSDQDQVGNRLLRMISSTDGTGPNTHQSQICHQRKYLEGTYAARVRFVDLPTDGPSGDQLVESFYTISPLKAPWDPDYSELDFEYLPNGGWGLT